MVRIMVSAASLTPDTVLTLTQALQLVGLVPCFFVVVFFLTQIHRNRQVLVPACYFLSLACGFALPLTDIFLPFIEHRGLTGALLFGESVLVAFSFLLILQFMLGRVPPLPYWLVLAIPLIGGGTLIYASLMQGGSGCLVDQNCLDVQSVRVLYNVFGASLVFLLLIYYTSRFGGLSKDDVNRTHKYALIVALILLHLLVLATELARLANHITPAEAQFTETVLRLTFIYLVITSLFRVFYPTLITQMVPVPMARAYNPVLDLPHVKTIQMLLDVDKIYREMRLNRAALAKRIGIGEHHLSRIINHHFGKNFNELINGYRIDEAKQRLKNEVTQITTIAYEVGFNSIASFNRVFKQKVGVSPTDYRGGGAV